MKELAIALHSAQSAVEAVKKDKKGFAGNYASTETLLVEARGVLSRAGLSVVCIASEVEQRGTVTRLTKDAEPTQEPAWIQKSVFLVIHKSGEQMQMSIQMPVYAERGKPIDKSTAAAKTYALGYFLRDLLLIPRIGENDEVDLRNDAAFDPEMRTATELKEEFEQYMRVVAGAKDIIQETPHNRETYETAIEMLKAQDQRNNAGKTINYWLSRMGANDAEQRNAVLTQNGLPTIEELRKATYAEMARVAKVLSEKMGGKQ